MKKTLSAFALLVIWVNSYSQATLSWSKDYEIGMNNYYLDTPEIATDNQSIKVTGRKNTIDGQRLEVVFYDLNGEIISARTFGNSNSTGYITDYEFDNNNQLYLLIQENISYNKFKILLQKYSLEGDLIWTQQIQDIEAISNRPYSLGITSGNCIFVNGYKETNYAESPSDMDETIRTPYLYAFNQNGALLWQRQFNSSEINSFFSDKILIYNETALLFSYSTLVKVDSNNNLTTNTIGINNGINNTTLSIDNNMLTTAGTGKYKITKVDMNGVSMWVLEYATFLPSNVLADEIRSITQDNDGNIYVTGRHYGHNYGSSTYTNGDILTLKLNPQGEIIWENRYQYGINNCDIGNHIILKNGYLYIAGESQRLGISTDYDYVTLKINATTGTTEHVYRYNGLANGNDALWSVCALDNGNYAVTGLSYLNSKYNWTTQFISENGLSIQDNQHSKIEVSPNPIAAGSFLSVNGSQYLKYKLLSITGQIVQFGDLNLSDSQQIMIDAVKSGIYLLQLENDKEITLKKLVVK